MKELLQAIALVFISAVIFIGAPVAGGTFGVIIGIGLAIAIIAAAIKAVNEETNED